MIRYAYEDMKYHKITSIILCFITTLFLLSFTFISLLIWIQKDDFKQITSRWTTLTNFLSSINDDTFKIGETASSNLLNHYQSFHSILIIIYLFVLLFFALFFLTNRKFEIKALQYLKYSQLKIFIQLLIGLLIQMLIALFISITIIFLFQNMITDQAKTVNRSEYLTYFPENKRIINNDSDDVSNEDNVSLPFNNISLFVSTYSPYYSLSKILKTTLEGFFISLACLSFIFSFSYFISFKLRT